MGFARVHRAKNPFYLSEEGWNGGKKKEGRKLLVAATVSMGDSLI